MDEKEFYQTIQQPALAEYKDRGSRFLAYAYPVATVDDFKERLQELKKEHPKAVHHCFAYRLGLDGNNFRSSDDGEPSGTAGKPILGQIDSKGLTNVLIVVVRYFGGTLLGVPGLINAYKTAASMALQLTPFVQKPVTERIKIHFDYTKINDVMDGGRGLVHTPIFLLCDSNSSSFIFLHILNIFYGITSSSHLLIPPPPPLLHLQ